MVWTRTCWQPGCKEDVWGKTWQKFGVQDGSAVWLRMTLCSNKYGRSLGIGLMVETYLTNLFAGESSSYFTLSEPPSSLSFTLSVCLPRCLEAGKGKFSRPESMWEDLVGQKFKMSWGRSCVSTWSLVCAHQQTCQEAVWCCIWAMSSGAVFVLASVRISFI